MSHGAGSYAGDVEPKAAWTSLESDPAAALVDVRTTIEWNFVGLPDLDALSKRPLLQEWQRFPAMSVDPGFVAAVAGSLKAAGASEQTPVFFLCRSGARSQAAASAMAAAGWTRCFNVLGGFEGPLDDDRHRGATAGWKADGLPWIQS